MKLVVNQILVDYAIVGSGQPILFLHGWASSQAAFKDLVATLSSKFSCLTLDLPGFGQSEAPHKAWTVDDYSDFLHEFLAKLNYGQPLFAVVGHSNGGTIAIHGLASGAIHAQKLVLLGSAGVRNKDAAKKSALKIIAKTGKVVTKPLPAKVQNKLRGKLYSSIGSDMLLLPHMEETFKNIVGQDVTQEAGLVRARTLLIYGAQDDQTPVADGEKLTSIIPDARMEVVSDAGHFVQQDATEVVNRLVGEFLV